jgi:hypothetical protein
VQAAAKIYSKGKVGGGYGSCSSLAGGRKHYLRAFFLRDFCCIFFLSWCRHFFKYFFFLIFVFV